MKKYILTAACIALSAITLCACGKDAVPTSSQQNARTVPEVIDQTDEPTPIPNDEADTPMPLPNLDMDMPIMRIPYCVSSTNIQLFIDGNNIALFGFYCKPISGVQRRFLPPQDISGRYTVEYIRTPHDADNDDALQSRISRQADGEDSDASQDRVGYDDGFTLFHHKKFA